MKKLTALLLAAIVAVAATLPASAQFRIGPRLGIDVSSMSLDKSVFDSNNRTGFTGGVQAEFTIPVINVGFDAAVMYVHRVSDSDPKKLDQIWDAVTNESSLRKRDYIEIPVNVKYKVGIPVIGKIFTPYVYTGPSFAFLTSKKAIMDAWENRSVDIAWNLGIGFQFFNHLQIAAQYGWGITKSVKYIGALTGLPGGINPSSFEGRNNAWTITAAWLF